MGRIQWWRRRSVNWIIRQANRHFPGARRDNRFACGRYRARTQTARIGRREIRRQDGRNSGHGETGHVSRSVGQPASAVPGADEVVARVQATELSKTYGVNEKKMSPGPRQPTEPM